tara:strand:+ start:166 stop:1626 length:1461 start_codon:yes stop_codon:yes gene_type:complete
VKKKALILFFLFLTFFVSRILYINLSPLSSGDVKTYALYSYFWQIGEKTKKSPYTIYNKYILKKIKHAKSESSKEKLSHRQHIEYPPLAVFFTLIPGYFINNLSKKKNNFSFFLKKYYLNYRLLMFFIEIIMFFIFLFLLFRLVPHKSIYAHILYFISITLTLSVVSYDRLDLVLAFFIMASLASLLLLKSVFLFFLFLAFAINFKLSPVVLLPLWVFGSLPYSKVRRLLFEKQYHSIIFQSVVQGLYILFLCTLVTFPFYIKYGLDGFRFFAYHSERPVQIESFYSSLLSMLAVFGYPTSSGMSFGSVNIYSNLSQAFVDFTPIVMILVSFFTTFLIPYCAYKNKFFFQKLDNKSKSIAEVFPSQFISLAVITIMGSIISFKVFSPQYILWFIALTPLCFYRSHNSFLLGLFLCLVFSSLSTYIFPFIYKKHIVNYGLGPSFYGASVLALRNILFFSFFIFLIRNLLWRDHKTMISVSNKNLSEK